MSNRIFLTQLGVAKVVRLAGECPLSRLVERYPPSPSLLLHTRYTREAVVVVAAVACRSPQKVLNRQWPPRACQRHSEMSGTAKLFCLRSESLLAIQSIPLCFKLNPSYPILMRNLSIISNPGGNHAFTPRYPTRITFNIALQGSAVSGAGSPRSFSRPD